MLKKNLKKIKNKKNKVESLSPIRVKTAKPKAVCGKMKAVEKSEPWWLKEGGFSGNQSRDSDPPGFHFPNKEA